MNGEYVDHREFDNISPSDVQKVLDETDWDAYSKWWDEKELPQGLQLINLHCHTTTRAYCELICEAHGLEDRSQEALLRMAITVDSGIS